MERETRFNSDKTVRGILCESTGEYVLPDYKGDVKKILSSKATAIPTGKFPGQGKVEYTGIVRYNVVYLDSENNICSAEFSSDYQLDVKCADESYIDSTCRTFVSSYSLRLMGPRKFSMKANLDSTVYLMLDSKICLEGNGIDREDLECSTRDIEVGSLLYGEIKGRKYEDDLTEIEDVIEEEIKVLMCNAEPRVLSVNSFEDEAELKAEVTLRVLVCRGDETPNVISKVIPIFEKISIPGLSGEDASSAFLYVASAEAKLMPSESGVSVNVSVEIDAECFASRAKSLRVLTDCFCCNKESSVSFDDFLYSEPRKMFAGEENVKLEMPVSDTGMDKLRNVVYSDACVIPEGYSVHASTLNLKGKIKFSGIACEVNEAGMAEYAPLKFDLPVDINVNISCQIPEGAELECTFAIRDVNITSDSEKLYAFMNLSVVGSGARSRTQRVVRGCDLAGDVYKNDESEIVVYYPSSEDSLFDIAKRFHVRVMDIASSNSLTESVFNSMDNKGALTGIKKLIIR